MKAIKNKFLLFLLFTFSVSLLNVGNISALELNNNRKEENVYANLTSHGEIKGIYVVNDFTIDNDQELCDYGEYNLVKNLTTTEKITYLDGRYCVKIPKGKFSYQGNMKQKELPWNIEVIYYLNGKELKAEEMIGKKGKLQLVINIKKNKKMDSFFFKNYLLQATVTLNTKKAKNIEASGATIANVGENKQIKYNILAGNEKSIKISADVEDFEMESISINGVPMKIDVTIDNVNNLTNQIRELQFAISSINRGSNEVDKATLEVKNGAIQLENGAKKIKKGLGLLGEKSTNLLSSSQNIMTSLQKIDDNTKKLYQLNNSDNVKQLINEINKVDISADNPYNSYILSVKQLLKLFDSNKEFVDAIYSANLYDNYTLFDKGLNNYIRASQEVISGYNEIYKAIDQLSKGIEKLKVGTSSLSKGTNELNQKTLNMDKKIDQMIEDIQEEFNNSNFKARSFVSKNNTNVENVQFVIQTDALKREKKVEKIEPIKKNNTFMGKIKKLFK